MPELTAAAAPAAAPAATPAATPAAAALPLGFDALRSRAITTLQRLAGDTWTDHNSHDPGITILEALCYALTDLGYRTAFDVPDLLADSQPGGSAHDGLFTPAEVLTSAPVTLDDLRRLVIDVAGVKNAWIEPMQAVVASYDAAQQWITPPLSAQATAVAATATGAKAGTAATAAASTAATTAAGTSSPNLSPVSLRGLYRVRIEKSGWGEDVDGSLIVQRASQRLQRYRGLGEDFGVVQVLDPQPVALDLSLELDPACDVTELLAGLYGAVSAYLSPAVPWHSLRDRLASGARIDQIFEGPLLDHGFIDPDELAAAARRDSLRLSDLIHLLMDLAGVLAVKSLKFLVDGKPSRDWLRTVDEHRCARFDIAGSSIRLHQRGARVDQPVVAAEALRRYGQRMALAAAQSARVDEQRDLPAPSGRNRQVSRYHSVLNHFPQAWGFGPAGLADSLPAERHAQARQGKAYLQFFDQMLANQFAQLGQARRLFALDDPGNDSYFSQPVADDDGALGLADLRVRDPASFAQRLQAITEDPWAGALPGGAQAGGLKPAPSSPGLLRRNRLLDHLLARFGEQFANHTLLLSDGSLASADPPVAVLVRDKQAFLRDLPRIGHDRGVARNMLGEPSDSNIAGLALRLSRRFGLRAPDERFHLVEHILLRPLPQDQLPGPTPGLPLLRAAAAPDPYSLSLSFVFAGAAGRLSDANFRSFVEQTVRDEAPAHLGLRVLWLDAATMLRFDQVYGGFCGLWRDSERVRLGIEPLPAGDAAAAQVQAPLRSLRNRVIDLLGLGDTAPLADLQLGTDKILVAFGARTVVSIEDAEADVDYALRGPDGAPLRYKTAADAAAATVRQGSRVEITTPPILEDIRLRVRALKRFGTVGPRWLNQAVAVKVGLDTTLAISLLDCPLLDSQVPVPQPGDARLVDHGRSVTVQIDASQEGVEYQLVLGSTELAALVVGNFGPVTLATGPLTEDLVIAVKATKRFPISSGRSAESSLLDARLSLKLRANPGLAAVLVPGAVVAHRQAPVLRITASQASARYRVLARRVRDAEWQRDPAAAPAATGPWLSAGLAGTPRVAPPQRLDPYDAPAGFVVLSAALPVPGSGGPLDLPLPPPEFDQVLLVQAFKTHVADPSSRQIDTQVLLDAAVLLLVRPDTQPALRLQVVLDGAQTTGELALAGGQPGVFYAVQPDVGTAPALPAALSAALPAYFHQRDDRNPAQNKGLGQLGLGLDFVVAGAVPGMAVALADRAATAPPDPSLLIASWAVGTRLNVLATRAQTGLQSTLARQAVIAPLPTLSLADDLLDFGATARLSVQASAVGDRYLLRCNGQDQGPAQDGNGADLVLASGALIAAAVLELVINRPADPGLALTRVKRWPLQVRPNVALALSAQSPVLSAGQSTQLLVQASEPGVRYQLEVAGAAGATAVAVGAALTGTGADLALPTGPISAATTFQVSAVRDADPRTRVLLAARVSVSLPA